MMTEREMVAVAVEVALKHGGQTWLCRVRPDVKYKPIEKGKTVNFGKQRAWRGIVLEVQALPVALDHVRVEADAN